MDNQTTKPMSTDELILALAQELRDYADAAEEAGESINSTEQLLKAVDEYFLQS